MIKRKFLKNLYKQQKNLLIKNKILKLLINKKLILDFNDISFQVEQLLMNNVHHRYIKNYDFIVFEI